MQYFNENFRATNPHATQQLLASFQEAALAIHKQANNNVVIWNPPSDTPALFNHYLDMLGSEYICKFDQLCQSIIFAVNNNIFLLYGLAGRSMIEHAAVMRFYFSEYIKPAVDRVFTDGIIEEKNLQDLIEHLDHFLRGGNFDWALFLEGQWDKLMEMRDDTSGSGGPQIKVGRCISKWEKEKPVIGTYYNLFCDLVHPNIGSSFLVMRKFPAGIGFCESDGVPFGKDIFMMTLPGIVTILGEITNFMKALLLLKVPIKGAAS